VKKQIQSTVFLAAMLATGLASPLLGQTTHSVGSAGGMDFATLADAIASASVVAGDTLLLDPNNNGNAIYAPAEVTKGITVLGQNNPQVGGAIWFINTSADANAPVAVTIRDLTVTGAGNNGVVVNGDGTVLNIDSCTITAKPRNGVNINAGTVNITGATVISNNGWAGISIGGGASPSVTITGTASTPVILSGNGNAIDATAEVTKAALSTRQLVAPGSTSATWNVQHAVISGSPYGFSNQTGNAIDHTVTFQDVDITDVSLMAVLIRGDNTTMNYDGGTISGRTAADANAVDNFEIPLVYITQDSATNGNDFIASNLTFPAGNTAAKLRSESNPIQISDSVINGGTGPFGFIYVGAGGAIFDGCSFIPQGQSVMQAVGGTAPITLIDPTFAGTTAGVGFYLQGHTGEFSIVGSDPANKVSLDGMANVAVLVRNWGGTATFTNVTSTTNASLFDCFGMGALAGPVVVNVNQSVFNGIGGLINMRTNAASAQPVTINATNTIWLGDYGPTPSVLDINDPNRTEAGTINLVHCTIAPNSVGAGGVVLNTRGLASNDVINSSYSIIDASTVPTLVASTTPLTGGGNLIYSTGGATATGGWVNGFPGDSIIADPQLAANGELTAASLAVDTAVGSITIVDYAGNSRPQGNAPDIGAHESAFTPVRDWIAY
jgi:hypothetical protein